MKIDWKPLVLLTTSLMAASCTGGNAQAPDPMISVGTHRLQIHQEGSGNPPVVIDTGLGEKQENWRPMQELLARVTRVVTYNRAGYGASEPGPLPRHCGREAQELRTLLDNASVTGPFVLVGHSLGALNVQVFASRYPSDVAAILLLDPPPLSFILGKEYPDLLALADRMTKEWQSAAESGARSTDPEERSRAAFFRMIASEHEELFGESASLVSKISSFGNIPLVVIGAGKPNPSFGDIAGEYQRYWIEQSRGLSRKSSRGRFVLARESSHHLYADAPELVEETIVSLVLQSRGED